MLTSDVLCRATDGEVRRLSPGGGAFMQGHVALDGERAVFWGGTSGPPRVWVADLTTGESSPVGPPGSRHPVWDPAGERIVFSHEPAATETVEVIFAEFAVGFPLRQTRLQLCSMRPDGSDVQQLTDDASQDQRPAVAPNGDRIVFVSTRSATLAIWILDTTTGQMRSTDVFGYRPWWSDDGQTIYHFGFPSLERHQVGAYRIADGSITPFAADDRGRTHGPCTDPTGDRLLVHSDRDGHYQLYELPLDGGPMVRCTPAGFEDRVCGHATRSAGGAMVFDVLAG